MREAPHALFARLIADRELVLGDLDGTYLEMVDVLFYASMLREEREPVRVSLMHDSDGVRGIRSINYNGYAREAPQSPAWHVTPIAPQPLSPKLLAKLSKGLRYGKDILVVGGKYPELCVVGIARRNVFGNHGPPMRLSAPRPGALILEHGERELVRYEAGQRVGNVFDLLGRDTPVRERVAMITADPGSQGVLSTSERVLGDLLKQMREIQSGGIVAMRSTEPTDEDLGAMYRWEEPDQLKAQLDDHVRQAHRLLVESDDDPQPALKGEAVGNYLGRVLAADRATTLADDGCTALAQLTAVDGALLIGPRFRIYGVGHLIGGSKTPEAFVAIDGHGDCVSPEKMRHGARHAAAFRFANDHREGVAFVVSEDGPVKCAMFLNGRVICWEMRIAET